MSEGKTQIEQIRDVLQMLEWASFLEGRELSPTQLQKIKHIGQVTLNAILGLESK